MVVLRRVAEARRDDVRRLEQAGATLLAFDERALAPMLRALAERDVQSLLVEGGPRLVAALFGGGLVDRVQWVATPAVLARGVPAARPAGPGRMGPARTRRLGPDLLVEWDVHGVD
jgi:diaminohydroxyphosphoribosylaminopyrimidine deaminase/5-amino-6-(5-phosphoribosylamino)uracil reductase